LYFVTLNPVGQWNDGEGRECRGQSHMITA
jgi:hypothetical protein